MGARGLVLTVVGVVGFVWIADAWVHWRTPLAPAPSSLTAACVDVDVAALRRVVGAAGIPDVPPGMYRPISWDELVRTAAGPRDVLAHWAPPYPRLASFGNAEFSDALVLDAGGFGARLVHRPSPGSADWFFFPSSVHDPVCVRQSKAANGPAWTPRPPASETLVAIRP